jgi:UDP:flavonoid glycosyltransferase YjiC (YdhE family)
MFDLVTQLPLYMQASVPGFEYPRSDLAPQVHFIGMMPVAAPHDWQRPTWWSELDGSKPVVHITQGTVANTSPQLIAPAIEGLANEDVLVVVSTGGPSAETMGLRNIPANVRVASFLSYPELLPRTAAMVTNGGYGGTQLALSHGVPLAVAGKTEDKPEVAARVGWSGTGINLKTASPTPTQVRNAVRTLLDQPHFRQQAQVLQAEYAQYNAVKLGAELVEQLAATGRPVLRSDYTLQRQEQNLVPAPTR